MTLFPWSSHWVNVIGRGGEAPLRRLWADWQTVIHTPAPHCHRATNQHLFPLYKITCDVSSYVHQSGATFLATLELNTQSPGRQHWIPAAAQQILGATKLDSWSHGHQHGLRKFHVNPAVFNRFTACRSDAARWVIKTAEAGAIWHESAAASQVYASSNCQRWQRLFGRCTLWSL